MQSIPYCLVSSLQTYQLSDRPDGTLGMTEPLGPRLRVLEGMADRVLF